MSFDFGGGATSAARIGGRSGAIFNTIARSRTSLLACASLIAVLTLGAQGQALAACGTITTGGGAHAAPSGGGSVHSGASAPHVSTGSGGGGGCASGNGGTGTKVGTVTGGKIALAGVHTGNGTTRNTGNGTTRNTGSGTHARVANAVTGTHVRRH
jgi:hypothetical protein